MVQRIRILVLLCGAFGLAAVAEAIAKGATIDGTWRYSRVSDNSGVTYAGTIRISGGTGVHRLRYLTRDGVRTTVEFDVTVTTNAAGAIILGVPPARFIEQGSATGYSVDTFNCRWAGEALSCTSVDTSGRGNTTPFRLAR